MSRAQTLRIGSHPMNLSLFILRQRRHLEALAEARGWAVHWLDYAEGRDSGRLLQQDQVDWVGTGSTPPLYSRAAGVDLVYVGASASRQTSSALLVLADSPLQRIDQLRGSRIASTVGSYTDHFLAQALHSHHLDYQAVEVLDLPGREGQHALLAGRVQAWAALDPLLSEQLQTGQVRALGQAGDFIPNRSLFWANRSWVEREPQQAQLVFQALAENDRWIAGHIEQAAELLAGSHPQQVAASTWAASLRQRPWGIEPARQPILDEQDQQARLLFSAGLLNNALPPSLGRDLSLSTELS